MFKIYLQQINNHIIAYRVTRAIRRWEKRFPFPDSVRMFAKVERDKLWTIIFFENEEGDVLDHLILERHKDGRLILKKEKRGTTQS